MLWDMLQHFQIQETKASAADAQRRAGQAIHDIDQTQSAIDTLALSCAAMWELLSERLGVTEEELLAKIEEIDLRDGQRDGKITRETQTCGNCSRPNSAKRRRCLYCGSNLPGRPF